MLTCHNLPYEETEWFVINPNKNQMHISGFCKSSCMPSTISKYYLQLGQETFKKYTLGDP